LAGEQESKGNVVRTSTAVANNYICPKCNDALQRDHAGKGFVAHMHDRDCGLEEGEHDDPRQWRKVNNNDNGSLLTEDVHLDIGARIRMRGERHDRTVTNVMGSNRNGWRACFRDQGAVPTGSVEWRIVSFAPSSSDSSEKMDVVKAFTFGALKTTVEFTAAVIAIIAAVAAFIGWLISRR
jgi:hypothetical protein